MLVGKKGIERLNGAKIIVFGVGGVGGYVVEALSRAGIGELHLVDYDIVDVTNINRQIIANDQTIGKSKVDLFKERIKYINPDCKVVVYNEKIEAQNWKHFFEFDWDYVVDAIDMISSKILLAEVCEKRKIPIISSMGTANKFNPLDLKVADIKKTKMCPLAKVMRRELKNRGIKKLKVVYSEEQPIKPEQLEKNESPFKQINGTMSFVPGAAGLVIASEVVKGILESEG
jgi:tRNA A37 threonylcarbamoyladenosine dehydratase